MDLLILGSGFAGVWAAAAAARQLKELNGESTIKITVLTANNRLELKPRLYEEHPEEMYLDLNRILTPIGVRVVQGNAYAIDVNNRKVSYVDDAGLHELLSYSKLIVATGSNLRRPEGIPGSAFFHNVDTIEDAVALERHLKSLPLSSKDDGRYTVLVVGASYTGLEVATELIPRLQKIIDSNGQKARPHVVLIDRATKIAKGLGSKLQPRIQEAIDELGLEIREEATVLSFDPARQMVTLSNGQTIRTQTVVWTAGLAASDLTRALGVETDNLNRLPVDEYLRVQGVRDVYAAGDTAAAFAEPGHKVLQSCQHAIPLGKTSGHNAIAEMLGKPLTVFTPASYVTCVDLGPWGGIYTEGWDRTVKLTHSEGKERKYLITKVRIYPPLDQPEELLRVASPQISVRQATGTQ